MTCWVKTEDMLDEEILAAAERHAAAGEYADAAQLYAELASRRGQVRAAAGVDREAVRD